MGSGGVNFNVYEYDGGKEPSAARALVHGIGDFLTLGIWEAVGTPSEALFGEKKYLRVEYDDADKAIKVEPHNAKPIKTASKTTEKTAPKQMSSIKKDM